MTNTLTKSQKHWAASHDWFRGYTLRGVRGYDDLQGEIVEFTDFKMLYLWAGY